MKITEAQKNRFYNEFRRTIGVYTSKYGSRFSRALKSDYDRFVSYSELYGIEAALNNIDLIITGQQTRDIFISLANEVLPEAARQELTWLRPQFQDANIFNSRKTTIQGLTESQFFDIIFSASFEPGNSLFDNLFEKYTNDRAADLVTKVTDTTKDQIKQTILKGIQDGKSMQDIGRDIGKIGDINSKYRGQLIARTETASALNFSHQQVALSTNIKILKAWDCGFRNSRDWHKEAHEQTVQLTDYYIVLNERMMQPGDPSASAKNICNCGCISLHYVNE